LNYSFINGQNYFCGMRIVINLGEKCEGYMLLLISEMIKQQPAHQFLLLINNVLKADEFPANTNTQLFNNASDSLLRKRWRLDVELPSRLKMWKADVLVNMESTCSMTSKIPQVMYVPDLLFLHYPKQYSWKELVLRKFYFPRYFKKVKSIITPSVFVKQEIIENFVVDKDKIQIVSKFARAGFSLLDWEARSAVKDGYADGREYFLFVGGLDPVKNLMSVLKAFSQFKKWQHSEMKLLITGDTSINSDMLQKIKTFKFRDDVVVLDHVTDEQLTKLVAGAYALLYPSSYEGFGLPILEAMQSGTPVITSNNTAMKETGGDAVLYVDPTNEAELSAQMIKLYKDEALRERLIEGGKIHAAKYDRKSSVDVFWKVIESAVTN
jgi:glycosyltransferase involved in cell wall biosynthesis